MVEEAALTGFESTKDRDGDMGATRSTPANFNERADRGDLIPIRESRGEINRTLRRSGEPIQCILLQHACRKRHTAAVNRDWRGFAALPLQSEQELLAANGVKRTPPLLSPYRMERIVSGTSRYNSPMDKPAEQDPRVYLAAERTFLAWLRTGLGLMGVGFAVSRFGLFLRQLSESRSEQPAHTLSLSLWSGVALVALGVVVNISAVVRHYRLVHELSSGTWVAGRVSRGAIVLGSLLAAVGIGMAIYLVFVR